LNWALVKFKEGYNAAFENLNLGVHKWTSHPIARSFWLQMLNVLYNLGDQMNPHFFVNIVNETQSIEFLRALDEAHKKMGSNEKAASWFKGQQVNVDIDGTVNSLWRSRENNLNRFEDSHI
jgi:hypothetical protein